MPNRPGLSSSRFASPPHRTGLLYAKIERVTSDGQTAEQRLFALLSGLPFDDHIRQALTTQSDLTLAQATEACVQLDTGQKIHLARTDSVKVARAAFCWKYDSPEHLSRDCPASGKSRGVDQA